MDVSCVLLVLQNITVMLMNKESNHLKGTSYHWDMFIVAIMSAYPSVRRWLCRVWHHCAVLTVSVNTCLCACACPCVWLCCFPVFRTAAGVCAIFGLPVAHASLPHSVLHLQAFAIHGEGGDLTRSGVKKEIASVNDNRVSAFLVNGLIGTPAHCTFFLCWALCCFTWLVLYSRAVRPC